MKITAPAIWFLRWSLFILMLLLAPSACAPAAAPEPLEPLSKAVLESRGYTDTGPFEVTFKGTQSLTAALDGSGTQIVVGGTGSYVLEPGVEFLQTCAVARGTEYTKDHKEPVRLITEMVACESIPPSDSVTPIPPPPSGGAIG